MDARAKAPQSVLSARASNKAASSSIAARSLLALPTQKTAATQAKGSVTVTRDSFLSNVCLNGWTEFSVASCWGLVQSVEALLHCAIKFAATCLAMLLGTKNKKCEHAPLLKLSLKIARQVAGGWVIHFAMVLPVAAIRCKNRAEFYLTVQRFTQQKISRQPMLHFAILQQLVSQRHCGTSCWENCTV